MIAGITKAALVAFRKRRIRLEVCARQVIEQNVVADVEQIAPPRRQVIEDRLLVDQQPVMAAVELVDLGKPRILAKRSASALRRNHSRCSRHSLPGASKR